MYVPSHFAEFDAEKLHDFIEANSFGVLVSPGSEPFASHLPFLLDRRFGPQGRLTGHMASANPQWQLVAGKTALAIFSGPHAYVSPTWYEAENVVPTWNYVAVHVYGTLQLVEDRAAVKQIVSDTVTRYERSLPQPWSFDPDSAFIDRLAAAIVGFHIEIERIEGKWKLSQNHSAERRERVASRLLASDDQNTQQIGRMMQGGDA